MKSNYKYLVLFLSFLFQTFYCFGNQGNGENVLYLNSYHLGYYWSDNITNGILDEFSDRKDVFLYIEYMDTKRLLPDYGKEQFFQYLKHKYSKIDFDYILTSDNNALDFILAYREDGCFSNCPVVSCGITNVEEYPVDSIKDFTLIKEKSNFKETFDVIFSLTPGVKKINVFIDKRPSSNIYYQKISKLFKNGYQDKEIAFIREINLETLPVWLNNLEDNEAIYYIGVNHDYRNKPVEPLQVANIIAEHASCPVFAGYFTLLNNDIIGGGVTTGYDQGEIGAMLLKNMIDSVDDDRLNTLIVPDSKMTFNYLALKRWGIRLKQLPSESVVLNKPSTYWKEHKEIIIINIIIFSLLVAIIVLMFKNIKNHKRYELDLIKAKEKAEESDRLKSIFLHNLSHEFRTPMNSIVGFSDLLLESSKEEETKHFSQQVLSGALRLSKMFEEILEISYISAQKISLIPIKTDIDEVIEGLYKHKDYPENINENQFDLNVDSELKFKELFLDKEILIKVLILLLNNAYKYTIKGVVKLEAEIADENILFHIKDNGKGIAADKQDQIFSPFRHEKEDFIDADRGAGLGLSIAKAYVETLGGKIWVKSVTGKGSEFSFNIPMTLSQKRGVF